MNNEGYILHGLNRSAFKTCDGEDLRAVKLKRLRVHTFFELKRENAHANKIAAMYSLEALSNDGANAQQSSSLRSPIARASCAVFLSGEDHERNMSGLIMDRSVVDAHLVARRLMNGDAAFRAWSHKVLDADVCECSAHHHLMIASARAVGVEVFNAHAALT